MFERLLDDSIKLRFNLRFRALVPNNLPGLLFPLLADNLNQIVTTKQISQNLLAYRHKHLQKAIENAEKPGFSDGAALYQMVTMNGEECHNEWEITFEEIHRNGAIVFAIFDYIRYTGDTS